MPDPKIAGLRSVRLLTKPGTYFWCACGHSSRQPFCDGSHKGKSEQVPLEVIVEVEEVKKWCVCKHSLTPPFCDHSHRHLPGYQSRSDVGGSD